MDTPGLPALASEEHVCPACGISYAQMSLVEACEWIRQAPANARGLLDMAAPQQWRARPNPQTWSPVEYLCHLRDVMVTYTIRLHRVRVEDQPTLEPMLNDLRARRFRYQDHDVPATLAEFALLAPGVIEEADRFRPHEWARVATRLPGEHRTARWMLRQTAHECVHHVHDIEAGLGAPASSHSWTADPDEMER